MILWSLMRLRRMSELPPPWSAAWPIARPASAVIKCWLLSRRLLWILILTIAFLTATVPKLNNAGMALAAWRALSTTVN